MLLVSSSRRVSSVELVVQRWSSVRPFAMAVATVPDPEAPQRIDRISLSATAREHAASAAQGKGNALSVLIDAVHGDAAQAEWLAREFAYFDDHPLLAPVEDGQPPRYAATAELVTPESEALFARQAARARAGRVAVYESEHARGTDPAVIFDKLVAFMASQSSDFLRHTGWQRVLQTR